MKKRVKSKAPFILMLIGIILGGLSSLTMIFYYFMMRNLKNNPLMGFMMEGFSGLFTYYLISGIVGIILTIVLIFYIIKIKNDPKEKDFIISSILGGIGIILGMGVGGILILIGGIIGAVKTQ
jgi:uncharacterized BrkB/YihY/UPF0761 family membrane protein